MSRELFEKFNEQANINLGIKGNLSGVVVAYVNLAKSMGKENIAMEQVAALPPAESLNNPDMRLDGICQVYGVEQPVVEQSMKR